MSANVTGPLQRVEAKKEPLTEHNLRQIHALMLKGIDDEEAGRYRRGAARISGTDYLPPDAAAVPGLVQGFVAWLNGPAPDLSPVERAALAHCRLVDVHPFADGNGRTARLLLNLLLLRAGYPPAVLRREARLEYYAAIEQARSGNPAPMIGMVAAAVDRSLDVYLDSLGEG